MKIRTGFVSNSSSSSFLVAFKEYPSNAKEVKNLLFGDSDTYSDYPASIISEIVFRDIRREDEILELNLENLCRSLVDSGGCFDGYPEWEYNSSECDVSEYTGNYQIKITKAAMKIAKNFLKECEEETIYFTFNYADDNGPLFSAMEHGGLFKNLKHIVINHH